MSLDDKARAGTRAYRLFSSAPAPQQQLSDQQKHWIQESLDRLKMPSMIPDRAELEPD